MKVFFDTKIAEKYKSPSQKARVLSEGWVGNEIFCPNCGAYVKHFPNGKPAADFYCPDCQEEYELKSKKCLLGNKVVDGAYDKMIERLKSANNPNFFLLNYKIESFEVLNFFVVPKHFFIPELIEKRNPTLPKGRGKEWIGCNILLQNIPDSGKIFYIKNRRIESKENILKNWRKTLFLRDEKEIKVKGWLLDVMMCVDKLGHRDISLDDVYDFEDVLSKKHPENRHIKDKIRQQLQVLRDKGYIEFVSRGKYRIV